MEKLKRIPIQSTIIVGAVVLALAGCAPSAPTAESSAPASPTPTATTEPDRVDPAVELVTEYLEAIAEDDAAAAWALLSPETQEIYVSEDTYAAARADDGSVTAADAAQFVDGDLVSHAIPDQTAVVVEAGRPGLADAWVVRDTDAGPRIDSAPLPSTGQTPFSWVNPDIDNGTAFDPASPAGISFPYVYSGDTLMAEPPRTITGWLDGKPTTVTLDVAAGSGAEFVVGTPAVAGQVLSIAWLLHDDSQLWRTTTLTL